MTRRSHPRDLTREKSRPALSPDTEQAFAILRTRIEKLQQKRQRKAAMARAALRLVKKRGA